MDNDDRSVNVARRENLTTLLGVLGGAVGFAALGGCAEASAAPAERISSASEPLSGGSFLWADTVRDLRGIVGSDASSTSQPVLFLGGFASPGDGGGGTFYWDASASTGDDGGTIFVPAGSTTGRWKRVYGGALNVKWFGATGDGVTPDDVAIQAAINAATGYAAGGRATRSGVIFVPRGNYAIQNTLIFVGNVANTLGIEGELGGNSGAGYSPTAFVWAGPAGGTILELRALVRSTIRNVDFDCRLVGAVCVWMHSDQANGGAGTDGNVFERCAFLNPSGTSSSVAFLVGDSDAEWQSDNTSWDHCNFLANQQAQGQISAAACWRTQSGGNTCNFSFYHCMFGGAQYGIDWAQASGCLTVDSCAFANFGLPIWASGQDTACIRVGPDGCASIRACEVQCVTDASDGSGLQCPGGTRFITGYGGGISQSASTLLVEGCQVIISLPQDNIIVLFSGKMTLIGNQFFGGYGSGSRNQNPPQVATGAWPSLGSGNIAPSSIFSLNNVYPYQPPGGFAPFIMVGGNPPQQAIIGPGGYYGGVPMSVWSLGDSTVNTAGTACAPLQPWFGQMPRTAQSGTVAASWSQNPVPHNAAATFTFDGSNGPLGGTLVGDAVVVSSDVAVPPGVVLAGAVTARDTITFTAINMSGSPQTLTGNVLFAVHRRTWA